MARKTITSIGIEYDSAGIRAARVTAARQGKGVAYEVEETAECRCNALQEAELVKGLSEIRLAMSIKARDRFVTCIAGKQVYVAQTNFRQLPDAEMQDALRFEVRKNLTFNIGDAMVDYQFLDSAPEKEGKGRDLIVTAVANALIDAQRTAFRKAEISPSIVDVLPLAISNAFWCGVDDIDDKAAYVILHVAPEVSTIVIDGPNAPFYTRSIYLTQEEILSEVSTRRSMRGKSKQDKSLSTELKRSVTFYEKTHGKFPFGGLYLIGDYEQSPELYEIITEGIGLKIKNRLFDKEDVKPGKFDVAIALAMRMR